MTTGILIQFLETLVATALLIWFFSGPWQTLLIDITRQRLFEIRDDIFMLAVDRRLHFESDDYRRIREHLNTMIRLSHSIKLSRVIAVSSFSDAVTDTNGSLIQIVSEIKDKELRRELLVKGLDVVFAISALVILRNPLLILLVAILSPFFLLWELLGGQLKRLVSKLGSTIEKDIRLEDHKWA